MSDLVYSPRRKRVRLALCTLPFLHFARFVSLDDASRECLREYADVFGPPILRVTRNYLALPNERGVLRRLATDMEGALEHALLDVAWRRTARGYLEVDGVTVSLYKALRAGEVVAGSVRVDFGGTAANFVPEAAS